LKKYLEDNISRIWGLIGHMCVKAQRKDFRQPELCVMKVTFSLGFHVAMTTCSMVWAIGASLFGLDG
jgi:hypothetical protein